MLLPACVADSDVTSALSTTESIVIDGATGVTSAPRAHFPEAAWFLALAVIVAVVVRLVRRPVVTAAVLVVAAIPGFVHVLALRGDALLRRPAMADSIRTTLTDLQRRAPWPAVTVVREDAGRLTNALPTRTPAPGGRRGVGLHLSLRVL